MELRNAYAKVESLVAENSALQHGIGENDISLPSHEPESAPPTSPSSPPPSEVLDEEEGDGANDDVIITNVQAEQNNPRMTSNLKHQRNIQATHASSSMAAQAVAMGFPPESAAAIGNFAAKTVVKSFSFAQAATATRAGTSAPTNEPFPPLLHPGQTPGPHVVPGRHVNS